jgi:L-ascorbate metabolism protein UlaG (beta-lactamase superfamily)
MKKIILSFLMISMLCIHSCKDDDPKKSCTSTPTVSAGEDQTVTGETTATLSSTTNGDAGTWSILDGAGGEIHTGTPVTLTGTVGSTYNLKFESKNECGTSADEVKITFAEACGDDLSIDAMVENIHWIQQACFRIESSDATIYTDPNSITETDVADIILISHPHPDHFTPENLDKLVGPHTILIAPAEVEYTGTVGERIILKPGNVYESGCVTIKAVPAYNINKTQFHAKESNWVGYLITVNGITIYHTGDTERVPEMKSITTDIIMLPLGQTYTFDSVEEAVEVVKDVKAKVAIPMHFGLYEGTDADAVTFKNLLDGVVPVVIKERGK